MPPSKMVRAMAIAVGVAAAAGAAQLGLGYGLGVFSWLPTVHGVDESAWLASLTWTVWISTVSVVIGALVADRAGLPTVGMSPMARALWRCVLALAAALGGLIVVALTAVPSRVAQRADTFAPHLLVGGYAIAGVLLGLFVALVAVNIRPIATNLLLTTGWLWLLATVATVDTLAARGQLKVLHLGVWRVTSDGPWYRGIDLPGAALMAGSAFLIGAFVAWAAAGHGLARIGVALSGAAGPALIVAAYLIAAPQLLVFAPYAVLAGLAGSVAVAFLPRLGSGRAHYDQPAAAGPAQA